MAYLRNDTSRIANAVTAPGATVSGSVTVATDLDVDGTTNLDVVDIDGAVDCDGALSMGSTITVGIDGTGHDVKFFGATSGKSWLFDESADGVVQVGGSTITGDVAITGKSKIRQGQAFINTFHHSWVMGG